MGRAYPVRQDHLGAALGWSGCKGDGGWRMMGVVKRKAVSEHA